MFVHSQWCYADVLFALLFLLLLQTAVNNKPPFRQHLHLHVLEREHPPIIVGDPHLWFSGRWGHPEPIPPGPGFHWFHPQPSQVVAPFIVLTVLCGTYCAVPSRTLLGLKEAKTALRSDAFSQEIF